MGISAAVPISAGPVTFGSAQSLAGTAILAAPVQSQPMPVGRAGRVRFWVFVLTASGSNLTTLTVKLQQRYNDGTTAGLYLDLPSYLDDVQGAAQPKGSTFEVSHVFTVAAGNTPGVWFSFYLDKPAALADLVAVVTANAAGIAGDNVAVYAQAA
jgi:hypothetical protein